MLGHRRESRNGSLDETVRGCGGLSLKSAPRGTASTVRITKAERETAVRAVDVWFAYGGC